MAYNDLHRYFLRTMLSRGVLSEREAQEIIEKHEDGHDSALTDVVVLINAKIRPVSQELKQVQNEVTGEKEVLMLWTGQGLADLAQNMYSTDEFAFWRQLIEEIVCSEDKKISGIDALNIEAKIPKTRIQTLMSEWVDAHYLGKLETGDYILGSRAIHEYQSYFQQKFAQALVKCFLCTRFVYWSVACPNCENYFHSYCLKISGKTLKKWPCCKTEMDNV